MINLRRELGTMPFDKAFDKEVSILEDKRQTNQPALCPDDDLENMLIVYGLAEDPNSLEAQMRDHGVSWSDFF